jgi:hypothetical protein
LQVNGSLNVDTSTFRFNSAGNASIYSGNYYNLEFAPVLGSPTYTIISGALITDNYLSVGGGNNAVTVNAAFNDPDLDINGSFIVNNNANFIAPTSGNFTIAGDFTDTGSISHSNGTIIFDASATGTVVTASSTLYNVDFDNSQGGWIVASDITTENDLDLSSGIEFIASSSVAWYDTAWLSRK